MIEIIKPGLLTSIQDEGRSGLAYYAIPPSGPLDKTAAALANALVANSKETSVLECNFSAPTIHFSESAIISLTGAEMNWTIDGEKIPRNKAIEVNANSLLSGSFTTNGVRAYIAIQGKWRIEKILGSTATYAYAQFGGIHGKSLKKGEQIKIEKAMNASFPKLNSEQPIDYNAIDQIYFHKGPEWNLLKDSKQEILLKSKYSISPSSNRMGAKLMGEPVPLLDFGQIPSSGVFPGVIQLPPNGLPIVLLQDGPTTGGYPRIGVIDDIELGKFNQIRPGQQFLLMLNNEI